MSVTGDDISASAVDIDSGIDSGTDGSSDPPYCPDPAECPCETVSDCDAWQAIPCRRFECLNNRCINVGDPDQNGNPCTWKPDCVFNGTCYFDHCRGEPSPACPELPPRDPCNTRRCVPSTGCPVAEMADDVGVDCDDNHCTGPDYCSGFTLTCHPGDKTEDCADPYNWCEIGACNPFGGCIASEFQQELCWYE